MRSCTGGICQSEISFDFRDWNYIWPSSSLLSRFSSLIASVARNDRCYIAADICSLSGVRFFFSIFILSISPLLPALASSKHVWHLPNHRHLSSKFHFVTHSFYCNCRPELLPISSAPEARFQHRGYNQA